MMHNNATLYSIISWTSFTELTIVRNIVCLSKWKLLDFVST